MLSRIPPRKWVSWVAAAIIFILVATHYYSIDISSLTQPAREYLEESHAQNELGSQVKSEYRPEPDQILPPGPSEPALCAEPVECPEAATCPTCPTTTCPTTTCPEPEPQPEAEKKLFLDLPEEYTTLSKEDELCEEFYTEKYIQNIATSSHSLLSNNGSAVTEFAVATHPDHRKLNGASPVMLLQGVNWDPSQNAFVAAADANDKPPLIYGAFPLKELVYDENATGCLGSSKRQVIVYPALWEGTYPNIWHRLQEIWQAKHSLDAIRIALNPTTGAPYLTAAQGAAAEVVLPADLPGPWGDLWKIVTPSDNVALPPSVLSPEICYDVIVPTVGYASPFWSALLTPTYNFCPRQTLMTRFVDRVLAHYDITPRDSTNVATSNAAREQGPTITVVQRGTNRKFRDFDSLLEKIHERHPDAPVNVVDLALLSTRDQIALAQNTDVWVAHHGAGLTYVLFMARTAAVVEILPPLFVSRGFRWLSRMRGLVHFSGRAMWKEEFQEKFEGQPRAPDWEAPRQDDRDADGWQFEEWVWIQHEEILNLVDAAVASQKNRANDPL